MDWTKRRVAELKHLHEDGKTLTEIANHFGCSKNSVAGKVYRLMGSGSLAPERWRASWENISTPRLHECEWPFGDVGGTNFHFCGKRTEPGKPYCAAHCTRAYGRAERVRHNWTDGRLDLLQRLFAAGASGHQIAPKIGMSAAAVNLKIRELGLR